MTKRDKNKQKINLEELTTYAQAVTAFRIRLGIPQKTLADRIGISASYENRIEKGTRKPPKLEIVIKTIQQLRLNREEAEKLLLLANPHYDVKCILANVTLPNS